MTTLEKLTNKIHELVPETVELSFGCWIQLKSHEVLRVTAHDYPEIVCVEGTKQAFRPDDLKILGHPITLEHVLKAMNSKFLLSLNMSYQSEKVLELTMPTYINGELLRGSRWKLGKPLSKQSEQTINWFANILDVCHT